MPRILRAPIPATRDPFINCLTTPLPPDKNGAARFWASSWNGHSGTTGVVVNEFGDARVYRFKNTEYPGFYSAASAGPDDPDGLWLCGFLNKICRMDLKTGKVQAYDSGAPHALAFSGMPLDLATGKLLACAFPPPQAQGFIFDFKKRKAVKVFKVPGNGKYMRYSFRNADGAWCIVLHLPGNHVLHWDPKTDAVENVDINDAILPHGSAGTSFVVIRDDAGRAYFPHYGWYDPRTRQLNTDGPRPSEEMTWFGNLPGSRIVGVNQVGSNGSLGVWDTATGKMTHLADVPDATVQNFALTTSGRVVAVNVYGEFFRIDAQTGALECSRRLDTDSVGNIDCLCRLDKNRVLGTPFITQRFWEVNFKAKRGEDTGRMAPGFGEIMRLCKVGGKVYMGAYAGGELMEYDPAKPARYPENPRLVADMPTAMRAVAIDHDGRNVYCSASNHYGHLGCTLTRYDTRTGNASYAVNPLGDQQIISLFHDKANKQLVCGTTYDADCQSAPATTDVCYLATLNATTLAVTGKWAAPRGTTRANIAGPLGKGKWLLSMHFNSQAPRRYGTFAWSPGNDLPASPEYLAFPEKMGSLFYAGKPGIFVFHIGEALELWDARKMKRLRVLFTSKEKLHHIVVDSDSLLLATHKDVIVVDGCLKGI